MKTTSLHVKHLWSFQQFSEQIKILPRKAIVSEFPFPTMTLLILYKTLRSVKKLKKLMNYFCFFALRNIVLWWNNWNLLNRIIKKIYKIGKKWNIDGFFYESAGGQSKRACEKMKKKK